MRGIGHVLFRLKRNMVTPSLLSVLSKWIESEGAPWVVWVIPVMAGLAGVMDYWCRKPERIPQRLKCDPSLPRLMDMGLFTVEGVAPR